MTDTMPVKKSFWTSPAVKMLWAGGALVGGLGLFQALTTTVQPVGFSSNVPWGIWVAAYIYFSGLSAGAFLLATWAYTIKSSRLAPLIRPCLLLALVSLCMGLLSIALDLGHLERAFTIFLRLQLHSVMAWMVCLYTLYFFVLMFLLCCPVPFRAHPKAGSFSPWALGGMLLALLVAGGLGALFGTVNAREYWHSPLFPLLFIVGGLTTATGWVTVLAICAVPAKTEVRQALRALLTVLVLAECSLVGSEYLIPLWNGAGPGYDLALYILFGPYWAVFWICYIALGVILPLVLLARSSRARSLAWAGALVGVTFFAVRLNIVIPALITPQIRGLDTAFSDPVGNSLTFFYTPTWFEWQVLLGILALGGALWYAGLKLFPTIFPSSSLSGEVKA